MSLAKIKIGVGVLGAVLVVVLGAVMFYRGGQPKRLAVHTLTTLDHSLQTGDAAILLKQVLLPPSLNHWTEAEQAEFLLKTLRDEVSAGGIEALRKHGTFGPLREVFPEQAARWAEAAGVKMEDCVAFRAEKDGLRAEVVLVRSPGGYRVVRCNNVKHLAE